jgi:DNA glycosylase AlkZ-like
VTALRAALEERTVLRTWPMRGTLHLVPAQDARWMVGLMASRTSGAEVARRRQLGLEEQDVERAVDVLGAALAGGVRLTRAECLAVLASAGIPVAGQAGYHLLAQACRSAVACLAPDRGTDQTFVLLDDWAPGQRAPDRDEALATMALRYVRSHGPVLRRDLAGWTGLTLRDVDRGLALAGAQVCRVEVDGVEMIAHAPSLDAVPGAAVGGCDAVPSRLALPGFDEFVLGYKDRSLLMPPDRMQVVVPGGNGMFRSTLVRDGRVVGVWTRSLTRGRVLVDPVPLEPLTERDRAGFERALRGYAAFIEADDVQVRWPT